MSFPLFLIFDKILCCSSSRLSFFCRFDIDLYRFISVIISFLWIVCLLLKSAMLALEGEKSSCCYISLTSSERSSIPLLKMFDMRRSLPAVSLLDLLNDKTSFAWFFYFIDLSSSTRSRNPSATDSSLIIYYIFFLMIRLALVALSFVSFIPSIWVIALTVFRVLKLPVAV